MEANDFFDSWAKSYETHLPLFPGYQGLVKLIVDEVLGGINTETPNVLDIGVGTGIIPYIINSRKPYAHFFGVDNSAEMLQRIDTSRFKKIDLFNQDMGALDFEENYFDAAYSNFSIHHKEDKQRVLSGIRRILKPGSKFVLGEVVLDVNPISGDFLASVIKRWGYTSLHALKYSGPKAAALELEIMRRVYQRDGEYLETVDSWKNIVHESGFNLARHTVVDKKLGYHVFVCVK